MDIKQYADFILAGEFAKAEKVRKTCIPNRLYKFVSLGDSTESDESKLNTLETNKLWFSKTNLYNDPYEQCGLFIDDTQLEKAGWDKNLIESTHTLFEELAVAGLTCCLSATDYTNMPMWAHYANNSKGFCIECEVENAEMLYEVSYEDSPHSATAMTARLIHELLASKGKPELSDELIRTITLLRFNSCMKHSSWSHEKEYRLIVDVNHDRGIGIPTELCGVKFKKIILGLNCSEENQNRLCSISRMLEIESYKLQASNQDSFFPTCRLYCEREED